MQSPINPERPGSVFSALGWNLFGFYARRILDMVMRSGLDKGRAEQLASEAFELGVWCGMQIHDEKRHEEVVSKIAFASVRIPQEALLRLVGAPLGAAIANAAYDPVAKEVVLVVFDMLQDER